MRRRYSPEPKDRIPLVEEKPEPKHKDSEPLGGEKQDSKDRAPSGGEVPESESKINESLQDKLDSKLKESELVVQEGKEVIQDVSFVEDKTTSDLLESESETKMAEPSPELAAVLNRRQKVVTEQQAIGEVEERNRIHSKVIEKEGLIGHVPEVEEIIADNEVASVLRSRRQCKQEVEKYDKLDKGQCHKKVDDLGEIIADSEVAQMLKARRKETDSKFAEIVLDKPEPAHQDISKSSISTSSSSVSIKAPSMMQAHDKDKTSAQSITAKISSQMVSSSDVGVKNIVKRSRDSDSSCDEANKKDITSSVTSKSSFDNLSSKKDARANITSKYPIRKSIIEKQKSPEPVFAVSARVVKKITGPVNESDSANSSASETKVSPERTLRSKMSPLKDTLSQESSTTSLAIRRTESQKLKEAERPRGILKRTASAKKSGVIVDSELASILQRRRQKEGEEEEEEEKEEVSSVQAEIEETRRRESEHSSSIGDDEGVGKLSIAERIYHMQNRLEESKSGPITPKSASGATTPKYPLKGRAGSLTSKSSFSFDEQSESPSHIRGEHLIEKLSAIADKDKDFPQVAEKRALFQRSRKREDWRTRTQPVTQEEIQEADGAEVLRKSSASVFEKLSSEETANQKTEFPQHIPSSKDRRQRSERHKTLPVTAAELNAIPEGELAAISQLNRKPDGKGYRDSRADSGILSGSSDIENNYDSLEREPQTSDSLRSLGIEMDDTDDDPARMSVSAKASLFKQLAEKPKSSASGAKRYIDRKKRERSRTQPVTEDEVKDAAEIADGETTSEPSSKKDEKSEEIQKEIEETKQAEDEGLADDLSRKSLSEKVKLFSTLKELEKEETKKKVPPVVRKKNRKLTSRFNTQPVTVEEVEKAAAYRISPLAMSMVKPPDPEMLKGLSLSAQRELMAQHAEKVMSQPSSRSNSRHSSSIDLSEESAKGVVKSTEDIPKGDKGEEKPIGRKSVKELSKSVGDELSRIGREPRIPGGVRQINVDTHEELKRKFLKSGEAMEQKNEKVETKVESEQTTNDDVLKRAAGLAHEALAKTKEERKGILKKDGSFELSKVTSSSGVVEKSGTQDSIDEKTEKKDVEKDNTVTEVGETESEKCAKMKENLEKVIEKCDQVLEKSEKATSSVPTSSRVRDIRENTPEKEKSPERQGSVERKSAGGCASAIRRRGRDTKQPERYLTQPTETESPGKSPDSVRKMKYGAVRHKTQPVTPEEKREAEAQPEVGSSLKDRLSLLKKSGEEEWKKRVSRNLDYDSGSAGSSPEVKRRNKVLDLPRPSSIADRLNLLDKSQEGWRERVGETDAKRFTVAHKLAGQVEESPLMRKLKEKTRKETESDQSSSEVTSPSTPTREKIPLPTSIISGPPSEKAKPEPEVKVIAMEEEEVPKGPVKITIPSMDDEHLQSFFMSRQVTEVVKENVDVSIDDFNELFIIANDMLPSTRKIRPKRKHTASSKNPLKTMKTTVEIKTEYEEVSSGIAEKELKRLKTAAIAKDAGFAEAALAGLASKENFAKVELRKTNGTNVGKSPARLDPYKDLMLIHVKGRRRTQVRLVEPSYKSINSGDCYILVTPDKCIIWVGEFANVIEKAKAADIATFIHQKRDMGCKASQVDTVEEARHHLGTGKKFWAAIGGMGTISSAGPTEEDELYENHIVDTNMVYRLQDNSLVPCEEHWGNVPKHEMLKKDEVYVFDFGSELYIWQGKAVKPDQRKLGVKLARQLWETGYDYSACDVNPVCPLLTEDLGGLPSKAKERPSWALFGKVNQNMETILFREKFADWPDTSRLIKVKSTEDVSSMKNELADLKPYDAKLLLPLNTKPVSLMLEGSHVGRGRSWAEDMEGFIREQDIVTLGVTVWHVLEFEHLVVPEQSFGQFHDGDTYVVRWQYMITNKGLKDLKGSQSRRSLVGRERCAYFFWQGKHSTINEKGASALMTVELDEERGPQIRVDEGKEMPCFLNLFDGKMIIHIGKREEEETNTQGPCRSYCVRNEYESELCLIEVPTGPQQLRSHSSLLIFNVTSGLLYVWHGCKSPQHTRDLALKAAEKLKEKCPLEVGVKDGCYILIKEQEEGKELPEFWSFIGAKQEDRRLYHSLLKDPLAYDVSIRLFHMTSVSGVFEVNEVLNPSRTPDLLCTFPVLQSDLYKASQPALFLLDNRHIVYLWHGWWHEEDIHTENIQTGSAKSRFNIDRKCAMDTVIQYCKEKNPENPPCACAVYAGLEPLEFTNLFPYWETDESAKSINLRDGKVEGEVTMLEEILQKVTQTRYTFEELCEETLPDGVDPLKLEAYLEEEEFEEILEMSKEEFYSLPNWKQNKLKQQVGLF